VLPVQDKSEFQGLDSLDLVWGARAIGATINVDVRKTYYMLETKKLPAKKVGKLYVASREALRQFFQTA
jgi:hypothetical protein